MNKYHSNITEVIHQTIEDMYKGGTVDKKTMRHFDKLCLVHPNRISPQEIRELRERENMSQPVFARYLRVSKNLISAWERGVKRPGGPASLILDLIKEKGMEAVKL